MKRKMQLVVGLRNGMPSSIRLQCSRSGRIIQRDTRRRTQSQNLNPVKYYHNHPQNLCHPIKWLHHLLLTNLRPHPLQFLRQFSQISLGQHPGDHDLMRRLNGHAYGCQGLLREADILWIAL
jgi:hypothetical protein